jgi:hypothetical protein
MNQPAEPFTKCHSKRSTRLNLFRFEWTDYGLSKLKVHVFKGELRLRMFLVGERAYMLSVMNMEKPDEEVTKKFVLQIKSNYQIDRSSAKRR